MSCSHRHAPFSLRIHSNALAFPIQRLSISVSSMRPGGNALWSFKKHRRVCDSNEMGGSTGIGLQCPPRVLQPHFSSGSGDAAWRPASPDDIFFWRRFLHSCGCIPDLGCSLGAVGTEGGQVFLGIIRNGMSPRDNSASIPQIRELSRHDRQRPGCIDRIRHSDRCVSLS